MESIVLKLVTEENLSDYVNIVMKLCKEHFELRNKIGYEDYEHEMENYNVYNIIGDFKKIGVNYYFIENNNEPIIYVDSFYILPEYRKMGYGKKAIEEIRKKAYPKKVELHCLYGNEAELFYDKIGGKKLKIVYSFE